ncbi:MAG TPA: flagellar motor protein MotB [Sphingobium sp.]|nr:flagellar motor protein MotB [Sphingobium sp.]
MMRDAASQGRRSRWAISFADLLLLLLGFFVLLQASGQRRDMMLAQVRQQFGGRAVPSGMDLRAADLFLPGEALLSDKGRAELARIAARLRGRSGRLEVRSQGTDVARQRFDAWDLAAARLGAVARELKAQGVAGDRLLIRGLDQLDGGTGKGQHIRVTPAS